MAMTRQLWSINGLATELGKDRRTLGRALRYVPTDGTTGRGYQGWFMETALRALSHKDETSGDDPPTPSGFEVIKRVENPVDKAQLLTLMYLIYRIGPLATSMAVSTAFLTSHDLLRGVEAHTARGHGRQPCYRRPRSGETHKSFR